MQHTGINRASDLNSWIMLDNVVWSLHLPQIFHSTSCNMHRWHKIIECSTPQCNTFRVISKGKSSILTAMKHHNFVRCQGTVTPHSTNSISIWSTQSRAALNRGHSRVNTLVRVYLRNEGQVWFLCGLCYVCRRTIIHLSIQQKPCEWVANLKFHSFLSWNSLLSTLMTYEALLLSNEWLKRQSTSLRVKLAALFPNVIDNS